MMNDKRHPVMVALAKLKETGLVSINRIEKEAGVPQSTLVKAITREQVTVSGIENVVPVLKEIHTILDQLFPEGKLADVSID